MSVSPQGEDGPTISRPLLPASCSLLTSTPNPYSSVSDLACWLWASSSPPELMQWVLATCLSPGANQPTSALSQEPSWADGLWDALLPFPRPLHNHGNPFHR